MTYPTEEDKQTCTPANGQGHARSMGATQVSMDVCMATAEKGSQEDGHNKVTSGNTEIDTDDEVATWSNIDMVLRRSMTNE